MCPDIKPIRVAANLEQPGIILLIKYLQKERGNKGQRCRGGKILGCKCEDRAKILMEFAIKSRHYATETCQAILQVYDDGFNIHSSRLDNICMCNTSFISSLQVYDDNCAIWQSIRMCNTCPISGFDVDCRQR